MSLLVFFLRNNSSRSFKRLNSLSLKEDILVGIFATVNDFIFFGTIHKPCGMPMGKEEGGFTYRVKLSKKGEGGGQRSPRNCPNGL